MLAEEEAEGARERRTGGAVLAAAGKSQARGLTFKIGLCRAGPGATFNEGTSMTIQYDLDTTGVSFELPSGPQTPRTR